MLFDLAPSANSLELSATLTVNERVRQLQEEGRTIYHMGFGESRFPVHPKILTAFRRHATARSYAPVAGYPALRATIAEFYRRELGLSVTQEQVLVGPGSKSVLFALVRVIDGDLLLPRPSWVSYAPQAQVADKQVTWIDTAFGDEYCITPEELAAGIDAARRAGQNPRLLIINTPNNPSGVVYPASVLEGLAEVARENKLTVISDEIYALINHGERPHVSIAQYYPEGTAVTGGLSKHLSLGGWRFGQVVVPAGDNGTRVMHALSAIAGAIWSSPASPVQYAATVAYQDDPEIRAYVQTCASIHAAVTQTLYEELQKASIPCPRPSGAYYLYPSFDQWREPLRRRSDVTTSEELAGLLLDECGIAALPGTVFGAKPEALSLRLSTSYLYTQDDAQAEAAVQAYEQAADTDEFLRTACPDIFEVGRRFRRLVESLD